MGEKWIFGAVEGWEPSSWRDVTKRGEYRAWHKKNTSPKLLAGKIIRVDFHKFLPSVGLKDCCLRASGLVWDKDRRGVPYS